MHMTFKRLLNVLEQLRGKTLKDLHSGFKSPLYITEYGSETLKRICWAILTLKIVIKIMC